MKFSLNLNKIALLRNARGENNPPLEDFANLAIDLGIDGLTLHPRPDHRHATSNDVISLAKLSKIKNIDFNKMAIDEIVKKIRGKVNSPVKLTIYRKGEKEPLEKLTQEGELNAFKHDGFWRAMDSLNDKNVLEEYWNTGTAAWKVW